MRHTEDLRGEIELARRCAERGLELDALDPFVNFAMGRAFRRDGDLHRGLAWLERATTISPNYAQGEDTDAAAWAERAAHSPGAHVLIAMIAGVAHSLAGDAARAESWAANVRSRNPARLRAWVFSTCHQ